jgi:hypothetical protein
MLHLVGVQEVISEGGGTEPAGEYTFFYGEWNENHELRTGIFLHKRIISAFKWVEFISDRISYISNPSTVATTPQNRWKIQENTLQEQDIIH